MAEYPVQISKVQAPPLREETLARDRLLEWLQVKIHRRAVLLIAEAGYGKTTLLADFSRRTRLRIMWFRLDRGDRDWVGFLAYLVAAVRIHVPDFGASTSALLRETATSAPQLDTVLDTFLRELAGLPNEPSALVFDDFHLVDDAPDVRHILRELLARGPERMSFVFASRREPTIRLARLRALGEVAELGTNDLRFDATETARLFSETYEMRLEPSVLAELGRRTEGWAASLQLVRAAIHDRDPAQVRAFIASLSGAEGHLYDYLAEEVVGELPVDLQHFLMRTSLLETVDLVLGPIAADVDAVAARGFIEDGERHGLFGKGGPHTRHVVRAHPLVRDFLQDRLRRSIGNEGIRAIHVRVARAAEPLEWHAASRHYLAAGEEDDARRVLSSAIEKILATGSYAAASELNSRFTSRGIGGAADLVLRSKLAQQQGSTSESLALAEGALAVEPRSGPVLLTLVAARSFAGDIRGAIEAVGLLEEFAEPGQATLGRLYRESAEASIEGSLTRAAERLKIAAVGHRRHHESHFLGVTLGNEAQVRLAMGDAADALACAEEAIAILESSSAGIELVSARLARARAVAQLGDIEEARREVKVAIASSLPGQRLEVASEAADLELMFGRTSLGIAHLDAVPDLIGPSKDDREVAALTRVLALAQSGRVELAAEEFKSVPVATPHLVPAFELRRQLVGCLLDVLAQRPSGEKAAKRAYDLAVRQGAGVWASYAALLGQLADRSADPSLVVVSTARTRAVVLTMAADAVVTRLADLSAEAIEAVEAETVSRPWRWLEPLRAKLRMEGGQSLAAARLLEGIGEPTDIQLLRDIARSFKDARSANLGRALARRLAAPVLVEDLGRVRVLVGGREVDGSSIRRKVLALLCLLLTKTRWTANREEVVDALWPDLDPQSALNSLNQTVYFLRRVFEPDYHEQTSPGYVHQDGETIWLERDLITSRSARCQVLIQDATVDLAGDRPVLLAGEYRGRFALDFAYEEWAATFGDSLHASYLRVIEGAIHLDVDAGNVARGIFLAERASEVMPESEDIQLSLIRIYRMSGAHAAAAEQYGRYARSLREMGLEPPELGDV